jgi:hypothetical protein
MGASPGGDAALAGAAYPPVPREGLSLTALHEFAAAYAGHPFTVPDANQRGAFTTLRFEQLTTAQVVEEIIKPATLLAQDTGGQSCSYAELLLAQVWRRAAAVGCTCAGHSRTADARCLCSRPFSTTRLRTAAQTRFARGTRHTLRQPRVGIPICGPTRRTGEGAT